MAIDGAGSARSPAKLIIMIRNTKPGNVPLYRDRRNCIQRRSRDGEGTKINGLACNYMKRNTLLNLFLRLLIAAGVGPLLVVAVQTLLGEAFVAN